ncbi:MAG: hypothetical protein ACQUHE_09270 [Bacteroidia bacterium]
MVTDKLIPEQVTGSEMNAQAEVSFDSLEEAIAFYHVAKNRLRSIDNWSEVCGTSATTFELLNANGDDVGDFEVGSIIKIDIPGPGTSLGGGYDWVRIEQIEGDDLNELSFGFRVRPCANPENNAEDTAHFFTEKATSTFLVKRVENMVTAEMHGRNEEPNTKVSGFFDGLRNMAVGYSAKIGLSYPQWKLLVEGLVHTDGA